MKEKLKTGLIAILLTAAFGVGLGFGVKKLVDDAAHDRFAQMIDIHQKQPLVPIRPALTPIRPNQENQCLCRVARPLLPGT